MANMGTNLSQVFIANDDTLAGTGAFNSLVTTAGSQEVGVWSVDNGDYIQTALYKTAIDTDAEANDSDTGLTTVANPIWLKKRIQFAQGASGQPIATPLIDTRNIRSVRFDPYDLTEGHKVVCTPNGTFTAASVNTVTLKVIMRTLPVDQLSYHDAGGTDYTILSGTDPLPMGVFNATNHKSVSVEFSCTNTATFCSAGKVAVDAHPLLSKIVTATDTGTGTSLDLQSKHVGFTFDVIVLDKDGNEIVGTGADTVAVGMTAQVLGVGNDWQVHGEEIRCQSRYANFNRMYLPQTPKSYTVENNQYHKVTVEYAHNWPNSTGIAPAGALNQVVMYFSDSSTALVAGDGTIDETFNRANVTAAQKFVW